jgi:hypothetical protein
MAGLFFAPEDGGDTPVPRDLRVVELTINLDRIDPNLSLSECAQSPQLAQPEARSPTTRLETRPALAYSGVFLEFQG